MHRSNTLRFATSYLLLVAMLPGVTGCNNAVEPPTDEQAPDIPPASTFVMDFSDFGDGGTQKGVAGWTDPATLQPGAGSNWAFAALNVGVWSVVVTVTLAVPVAAFVESFNHEPERQSDGSWAWDYDVTVGTDVFSARLTAMAVGGDIEWNMYLSKEGEYTDFHWFSGLSNLVGTEGTWTLNRGPDEATPFIGIEWHVGSSGDTGDIKYTNIVPDGPENGGYIFYAVTDEAFDASYDIYDKTADNLTSIEWSRTDKDGRVMDADHFGDELWHCWGTDLLNLDCP